MIKLSDHLYTPGMGEVIRQREAAIEAERQQKREQALARRPTHRREYAAAKTDRLNSGWTVTPLGANWLLSQDLRTLRARARQMCRDVSHFRKFLGMAESNVIGPHGMRLQCRARLKDLSLNVGLNKHVEEEFWNWGHAETCTVSGKMNWKQSQRLFIRQLVRDGEVLVQKIKANNAFGFSLKFIDVSYLDELLSTTLRNGNRIIMSVEYDKTDRPVAYWLTVPGSESVFTSNPTPYQVRVPAEEIIHAFLITDDESQARGVTFFHAAMLDAKNLYGYKEGVITSARAAAMSMGFLVPTVADEQQFEGETDAEGTEKQIEIDWRPAGFTEMPFGYDVKQFDPKQPTQNHEAFYRSIVRDIAAGLGVNYFSLQGDMADVNYSSARVGLAEERDTWRALQDFVADRFCREVYHAWAVQAYAVGALRMSVADFRQIQNPMFRGRGWQYIDPLKEVNATSEALQNKLTTWTDSYAERGLDIVDVFETMRSEQALAKQYGVDLTAVSKTTATENATNADPNEDTPPKPPKRELTNGHGLEHLEVEQ